MFSEISNRNKNKAENLLTDKKQKFLCRKQRDELNISETNELKTKKNIIHYCDDIKCGNKNNLVMNTRNPSIEETDIEMIRRQYLGERKERKKVAHPSERMRFVFDWDINEDTTTDPNPLYHHPAEVAMLFGRGVIGGIDRLEQKEVNMLQEKKIIKKAREMTEISSIYLKDKMKNETVEIKDNHDWTVKKLSEMNDEDWWTIQNDFNIHYENTHLIRPIRFWNECPISSSVKKALEELGYLKPTPIQRAIIPFGLTYRDAIGTARAGSGRIASFVIPILSHIDKFNSSLTSPEISKNGPFALILSTHLERIKQIKTEIAKLARFTEQKTITLDCANDLEILKVNPNQGNYILIATPTTFMIYIKRYSIFLHQINYVVLDDVDQMIDARLENQVEAILGSLPENKLKSTNHMEAIDENLDNYCLTRASYMFSATISRPLLRIAYMHLWRPGRVTVGSTDINTDDSKSLVL
eukprot:gnl/TRDRNA2_/TRDRNA2_177693_c0_seq1.p1 gnl/TRDRNA2_/TRDRNA2_177693_c0~~gnl/TRDRNA2_/TRDRNA2_177693_c0_seq1.p1  ORF type:complete len:470 (+),score=4.12 gnl/TRDRNA2_/TRDRNA2_177693_c0_seq1:81-1490(+)